MEEQILELLEKEGKALSVEQINDYLEYKTLEDFKSILKTLNKLEKSKSKKEMER